MSYFKNVKSFEDLKEQFKKLAKINHPDAGGDAETMKVINAEYDELFPIWKHRYNATAAEPTTETSQSTRKNFYTDFGWSGDLYDIKMSLKDIAKNIRSYVKEIYPTYKFSITTEYASMCQELHVALMEAPHDLYKDFDDMTDSEYQSLAHKLHYNHYLGDSWNKQELKDAYLRTNSDFYKVYNEVTKSMIDDVDREIKRYNMEDIDSMIDYFHVHFYYFEIKVGKWNKPFKIVEKKARIKDQQTTVPAPQPVPAEPVLSVEYDIQESKHTISGNPIWLVKIKRTLSRDEYLKEAEKISNLDGYYSKFTHSFVFNYDPTDKLIRKAA